MNIPAPPRISLRSIRVARRFTRRFGVAGLIEYFHQTRKIERGLARLFERQEASLPRFDRVRLAVKRAKPPAFGILDGVTALQFADLPGWEPESRYGASVGH